MAQSALGGDRHFCKIMTGICLYGVTPTVTYYADFETAVADGDGAIDLGMVTFSGFAAIPTPFFLFD